MECCAERLLSPLQILSIAGGAVAFGVVLLPVIAWLLRESALPI